MDPRCIGDMTVAQFTGMFGAIARRAKKTPDAPPQEERDRLMDEFLREVSDDPAIKVH